MSTKSWPERLGWVCSCGGAGGSHGSQVPTRVVTRYFLDRCMGEQLLCFDTSSPASRPVSGRYMCLIAQVFTTHRKGIRTVWTPHGDCPMGLERYSLALARKWRIQIEKLCTCHGVLGRTRSLRRQFLVRRSSWTGRAGRTCSATSGRGFRGTASGSPSPKTCPTASFSTVVARPRQRATGFETGLLRSAAQKSAARVSEGSKTILGFGVSCSARVGLGLGCDVSCLARGDRLLRTAHYDDDMLVVSDKGSELTCLHGQISLNTPT